MISTLNEKDRNILLENKTIDFKFGSNSSDYIEVFLYDESNNFIDSGIVDKEDYTIQNDGLKLHTGTILRKLGYDRGRFTVKYNFFRKVAGSYETLLIDEDNKIWNGSYHMMNDGTIMDGTTHSESTGKRLVVKENSYLVQEISPSRTEVRLTTQNINNANYNADLYFSGKKRKKIKINSQANFTSNLGSTAAVLSDTTTIELTEALPKELEGSLIYLNDSFVERVIEPEFTSATNLPPGVIPDEETIGDIQARFKISDTSLARIKSGNVTTSINRMWNDFKQFNTIESIQAQKNKYESDLGKGGNENMRKSLYSKYKTAVFEKDSIVKIKSISQKPGTLPVRYTWTLSGLDFTLGESYDGLVTTDEAQITNNGGIQYTTESSTGSEISVKLTGNNTDVSVTLQIESKLSNTLQSLSAVKSVIYLPNILRTVKQK